MNLALFFAVLLGQVHLAASQGISCFGVNGLLYPEQKKCPGSNACCGVGAICLPNRLCKNPNDNEGLFTFLTLLPTAEAGAANVFPRVTVCADGSLCCNNDPQCCSKGNGRWLDERGNLLSSPPSQSSASSVVPSTSSASAPLSSSQSKEANTNGASASTDSSSTTTLAAPSTATTTATVGEDAAASRQRATGSESDAETLALKVGLGIGIPFAAAIAAFAVWCCFWQRRRKSTKAAEMTQQRQQQQQQQMLPTSNYSLMPGSSSLEKDSPIAHYQGMSPSPQSTLYSAGAPKEFYVNPRFHHGGSELQGSHDLSPRELQGSTWPQNTQRL
ncbi:hypothetical protein OOU_Y34scaffold00997g2 [Pyricularia oryzae Y34]|uniref:Uncharacterized protein n=2 Tax=Pyricularia oryzae TaxID=318829 RepID=A0AA97PFX9_PYRO3|nr:hypothetical protein OOU_Y34scaffold00997g2 [Pyricularia oryzae Y34]